MPECDLKPIADWIQEPTDEKTGKCNSCLIRPLAEMYLGELEEKSPDKAKLLTDAWDSSDVLTIAQALDKIKLEVGEPLKQVLEGYDCEAE